MKERREADVDNVGGFKALGMRGEGSREKGRLLSRCGGDLLFVLLPDVIEASLSSTILLRSARVLARERAPPLTLLDREIALPEDPVPMDRLSSDSRAV